jgi:hypothetical protein
MSSHELPHFLGIGAQKSATSWLDRCLRAHPGLWLPPIKELHYFTHLGQDVHPGVGGRLLGNDWVTLEKTGDDIFPPSASLLAFWKTSARIPASCCSTCSDSSRWNLATRSCHPI